MISEPSVNTASMDMNPGTPHYLPRTGHPRAHNIALNADIKKQIISEASHATTNDNCFTFNNEPKPRAYPWNIPPIYQRPLQ